MVSPCRYLGFPSRNQFLQDGNFTCLCILNTQYNGPNKLALDLYLKIWVSWSVITRTIRRKPRYQEYSHPLSSWLPLRSGMKASKHTHGGSDFTSQKSTTLSTYLPLHPFPISAFPEKQVTIPSSLTRELKPANTIILVSDSESHGIPYKAQSP